MGISSRKLVYDFRLRFNSVNSGRSQDIALVDVIAYLNEAQEIWFENRAFVAETNQEVRNDLRVFKKDAIDLKCESYSDGACLVRYPSDFYKRLNHLVLAKNNECCKGIVKEIIPRIVQSDDLHEARHNPFRKSDFFYEQLNAIETKDGLVLYHDNEMSIESMIMSYYRRPKEIHAPSLEDCDDENYYYNYCGEIIKEDQDFEAGDTFASNKLVDIAVLRASRDASDIQGFNQQLNMILGTKNLSK